MEVIQHGKSPLGDRLFRALCATIASPSGHYAIYCNIIIYDNICICLLFTLDENPEGLEFKFETQRSCWLFFLSLWPRLPIRTTGVLVTSTGVGDSLCG